MSKTTRLRSTALLVLASLGGAAVACAPPAPSPVATKPRMAPLGPSRFADDLRRLGLDPSRLPRFAELSPTQVHGLMSTFTRSLGLACLDCHDAANPRAETRNKRIAKRMWDDMARAFRLEEGQAPLYCDSCHHGQARFLDRGSPSAVSAYMAESYVAGLQRADGSEVACATCHGEPRIARFLSTW